MCTANFNLPIAEIAILTGIATKEAKAHRDTHSLIVEAKIIKCSLKSYKPFCTSYLLMNFALSFINLI